MAHVMDFSEGATVTMDEVVAARPPRLTTTLYELVAAIQDVVGATEDTLVVATVWHIIQSGRLTWLGEHKGIWASRPEEWHARQRVAPL